jgi:hypothetical protein
MHRRTVALLHHDTFTISSKGGALSGLHGCRKGPAAPPLLHNAPLVLVERLDIATEVAKSRSHPGRARVRARGMPKCEVRNAIRLAKGKSRRAEMHATLSDFFE